MRKIVLFILTVLLSLTVYADIIVTKANGNIENVTIVEIAETEIIYKQDGIQKTIPYSEVEAIMYDDGRYVTLPNKNQVKSTMENETSNNEESDYTNRIQQNNNSRGNSEVKNAFKKAGDATVDAFKTLFKSKKKDQNSNDENSDGDSNPSNPQSENNNNW
jgi:hypothetical protein